MRRWLQRWWQGVRPPPLRVPDALWRETLQAHAFLQELAPAQQERLRELSALFLDSKEFHGAQDLPITDAMAVSIAAQACLPILHFGPGATPLRWYDDFVGIVVHPAEVLAPREVIDDAGVVHEYAEALAGEAMPNGPVMLSWQDVAASDRASGYNVVIHEFVHKLDLRDGLADGIPPLPAGFMGQPRAREARRHWHDTLQAAYDYFSEQVIRAERFGQPAPWLDPYGAESLDEFFAVTSEAYFVNRERFRTEFPTLGPLFDAFFRPASPSA